MKRGHVPYILYASINLLRCARDGNPSTATNFEFVYLFIIKALWVLFFWIMCGIASSIIARKKGNRGCTWFFLGLLLGPLGIVISFISKKTKSADKK